MKKTYLTPNWPAPQHIKAFTTTRQQGHSQAPYNSFNLANYVGDDPAAVKRNITDLTEDLELPETPLWLHQVHGTTVIRPEEHSTSPNADASITKHLKKICAVLTADCLPLLLCNRSGTEVAAVHAGWKGLLAGVIDAALEAIDSSPDDLLVWMGPALSLSYFPVGDEVWVDFINRHPDNSRGFTKKNGKWHADFFTLATLNLQRCGVTQIFGGDHCCYTEKEQFFSFRRDHGRTGRMASLIWIDA